MDEFSRQKGKGNLVTVVSDTDKGSLLEVINSHKSEEIIEVLKQQPLSMREQVREVGVDMWGGFPKVIKEVFPNALIVIDLFIENHLLEISHYFVSKTTSGVSEGINKRIKLIIRQRYGFKNFEFLPKKLLGCLFK